MAESAFLTTKATLWSRRKLPSPPWTDRHDAFDKEYGENEELPLKFIDNIGLPGRGVEKRRTMDGTEREVAVKRMYTYGDRPINDKLQHEVTVLRSLNHYHCVSILGTFIRGDFFNIVMEPCAKCDLHTYLSEPASNTVKSMEKLCGRRLLFLPRIMGCLAHGLQYLHKEPRAQYNSDEGKVIRHRDITPANIVLDGSRVLYTDFGLSKFVTATKTSSSGPSPKTLMYTSPERANDKRRNILCDIFSLAAVFAEIFNVYKGKTMNEFYEYRTKADPDGEGYFRKPEVMSAVLKWLDDLATERCDVQIVRLLRDMFSIKPSHRPNAERVWKVLTTITTFSSYSAIYFCGPCCMPLQHGDRLLETDLHVDPSQTKYISSLQLRDPTPVSKDLHFKDKYDKDQQLDTSWIRNLRHWNYSILDVVQIGNNPHPLARKRIQSKGNDEGFVIAKNEAEILRNVKVKHRHIVSLYGTYQHGDVLTLLFNPAADHDLRSYLELAETCSNQKERAPVDLDFMTRSFGCLANALACVHAAAYDHGDIRPENILVHAGRIYLSKFSFGFKSTKEKKANNQQLYRVMKNVGRLSIGGSEGTQTSASTGCQQRRESDHYQSPEWKSTCVAQPPSDIFALGCVFLEIYTVLCGRQVRDFAEFRADEHGEVAYHRTLPKALEWLSQLNNEEHENQEMFQGVIRSMIEPDANKRPSAIDVARIMRKCKTSSGRVFIGNCTEHASP